MRTRLPSLIAVVALIAAACTPSSGTTSSTSDGPVTPPSTPLTTVAATNPSTTTTEATTTTTQVVTPTGIEELSAAIQDQIVELVALTQDLRGLAFADPPHITVVTDEELAQRVRDQITEDSENVDADEAMYELLGLVDPGTDLLALYQDLYGEQVAGFYDGETGELVVPARADEFSELQQSTLVHELTHALTDQRFGLYDVYRRMLDDQIYDGSSAYLALIEGDAVLTEIQYLQGLTFEEQQRLLAESLSVDTGVFDGVPPFLQQSLLFPYTTGLQFVQRLYGARGWEGINEAYANGPASTEQVIEPRDYGRDFPLDVEPVDNAVPPGYEQVYDSVWGQLGFELMLEQILGDETAQKAGDGWGGDRYALYADGDQVALVLHYRGDTAQDATELGEALLDYVGAAMDTGEGTRDGSGWAFSGSDYAFVARQDDRVVLIAASDPEVGALLRSGHSDF